MIKFGEGRSSIETYLSLYLPTYMYLPS